MTPPHGATHAPPPPRKTERSLWFVLLAAPIVWSLAEIVGVSIVGRSCGSGNRLAEWQWVALVGMFVAAAIVAATAAVMAFRLFKRHSGNARITAAEGWNRVEFMAQLGFFVSLLLLFNIVLFGLAPLMVDPCLGG